MTTTATTGRDPGPGPAPRIVLSGRHLEVLTLIASGLTNARIGARMSTSEDTVKSRVGQILRLLGARDRAHAVAIAYQRGLLAMPAGSTPKVLHAPETRAPGPAW